MTPSRIDIDTTPTLELEKLLLRDDDVFHTSLNSEAYLDSLAPIVTDALKANALGDFITKLNDIVKGKDDELNEKSLDSAKDINTCIDTIDQVSRQSEALGGTLHGVNEVLDKSINRLIKKKKFLVKARETEQSINDTILTLAMCIQVLEVTNKIHEWIKQDNYFTALKLIDELTSIHLPKVSDFLFSVKIYDSIPHLTSMIKDESFDKLCKWLSTKLERNIDSIGVAVFRNLEVIHSNWENLRSSNPLFLPHRINSAVEVSMRNPSLSFNVFESPDLNIHLDSVYDCILVYESLGELSNLCNAYHKEWMKKYQRIIYPITLSVNSNEQLTFYQEPVAFFSDLGSLETYLFKIAAFFVADKQLNIKTKFQLRSNNTSDDLWESFAIKLKPVLLNYLTRKNWSLDDLESLDEFKTLIGNFLQVMENNQYKVSEIYDILILVFRDYFGPILIQHFRMDFIDSIQSDHYMPLVVSDRGVYDKVIKICWHKSNASFAPQNIKGMPISFPFSEDYVRYCLGVRTLLKDIIDFTSKHYAFDMNELNRVIVEEIFEKVLGDVPETGICSDIKSFITKNSDNKEIIAQSYTNLEYYLFSLYEIGKLIDRRLRASNGIGIINIDTNSTFKLKAIELFTNIRKFSEDAIFSMVDQKVQGLLDMVEYENWMPSTPNTDPNIFILEFSMFLENLFNSIFSNLPSSFRTLGLFRSYDYISEYFLKVLQDAPYFNRVAIENFDLDMKHLELSMATLVASQTNENDGGSVALQSTFAELRQTIDMLMLDSHDEFLKSSSFRMRRFDRLKLETAMKLIEKLQSSASEELPLSASDRGGLSRETSILSESAAKFASWGKFRKGNDN